MGTIGGTTKKIKSESSDSKLVVVQIHKSVTLFVYSGMPVR